MKAGAHRLQSCATFEPMRAMVFRGVGRPLSLEETARPEPGSRQVLVKVSTCAVCRTDLHVVEGDLTDPKLPLVPGHEVVGTVESVGPGVPSLAVGQRVGVPWMGSCCGICRYCGEGTENLCGDAGFTGYTIDGGYAEWLVADQRFCLPIPESYSDVQAAPLMCAGLIGYRSLLMAGDPKRLGIYGFGAAAHIIAQVARFQGRSLFAFTRPGDTAAQNFARRLGAVWAGDSLQDPPEKLDAAIIFAPVGSLVPQALRSVSRGGTVVCGGIHMSDIPSFPYELLWGERTIRSVANLTRRDGLSFMEIASRLSIETHTRTYPLEKANEALSDLGSGRLQGAAVLVMDRESVGANDPGAS